MGVLDQLQALPRSAIAWFLLALLRLVWTLVGQNGYLHPDEFFQSIQIVTEDLFDQTPNRTWEFTSDNPIRNIAIPYVVYGFPIKFLSILIGLDVVGLNTDNLIMFPRMSITVLSFLNDYFLFKSAQILKINANFVLVLFASSYVTLVYLTHTFSNSIETFLFTILVYLVLLDQNSRSKRFIAIVLVVGVFNRPTFVLYSIVPLACYLAQNVKSRTLTCLTMTSARIAIELVVYAVPTAALLVAIDTFYYRQSLVLDLGHFDLKNIVVTPLNFFLYNINSGNLELHGAHKFYQHAVVNCFLLFGLNYVVFLCQLGERSTSKFVYWSFIVPLIGFTFISHQEPRFLLPLIIPVCLLTSQVTAKHASVAFTWSLFNFLLAIVYGIYHQGALIKSIDYVNGIFQHTANSNINTHVIFYHTYMVPAYLINVQQATDHNPLKNVHDLMSSLDVDQLETRIQGIVAESHKSDLALFLLAPSTFDIDLCSKQRKFRYEILYKFLFHAQFESVAKQVEMISCRKESCNFECKNMNFIELFIFSLTLNFYQIIV
jgi:phosphatidylinositol glycan class Z